MMSSSEVVLVVRMAPGSFLAARVCPLFMQIRLSLNIYYCPPDQFIYVWHRETAEILETLDGHKHGSVNTVTWNPVDDGVFASCSDDGTIRVWEAPTWTSPGDSVADASTSSHPSGLQSKALYSVRTNGSHHRAASPNWQ